jgi:hypothetical protein
VVEEARTRVDEEFKAQKKEFKKKHGNDAAFEVDPAKVRSRGLPVERDASDPKGEIRNEITGSTRISFHDGWWLTRVASGGSCVIAERDHGANEGVPHPCRSRGTAQAGHGGRGRPRKADEVRASFASCLACTNAPALTQRRRALRSRACVASSSSGRRMKRERRRGARMPSSRSGGRTAERLESAAGETIRRRP